MSGQITDAAADSSSANTGADQNADTSQATTQPGADGQSQQPRGFHEHPDWQRMVASRREDRAVIQQLRTEIQRLGSAVTARSSQPDAPLSQEEQAAITTLKRLMARDPELAAALGVSKQFPQLQTRLQGYEQSQAQAARAHTSAARSFIKDLATEANLPVDDANIRHIVRLVASAAGDIENGNQRYSEGDMEVLREAFNGLKPWLEQMRKPVQQQVGQTKTKLKNLPTPTRSGSTPGPAATPKLERGKERAFEADMHSRARKLLGDLTG
jgi:hypothetical protein